VGEIYFLPSIAYIGDKEVSSMKRKLRYDVNGMCAWCGKPCLHCLTQETYERVCSFLDNLLAQIDGNCSAEEMREVEERARRLKIFIRKRLISMLKECGYHGVRL
jgi:hypothetical protein